MCSPLASARADVCPSICLLIRPFNHLIFTSLCGATVLQSNALQRVASRRAKPTKPTPTNHTPYRGVVGLVFWFGFARRDATREDTPNPKQPYPLLGCSGFSVLVMLIRAARHDARRHTQHRTNHTPIRGTVALGLVSSRVASRRAKTNQNTEPTTPL